MPIILNMAMAAYLRQPESTLLSCLYNEGTIHSNTGGKTCQPMETSIRQNGINTNKMWATEQVNVNELLFKQSVMILSDLSAERPVPAKSFICPKSYIFFSFPKE